MNECSIKVASKEKDKGSPIYKQWHSQTFGDGGGAHLPS